MSDFQDDKRVTTRKDHKCAGCFAEIPTGTNVTYQKGVYDGYLYSHYMCDPCVETLNDLEPGDEWAEGELGEIRRENERHQTVAGQ